MAFFSLVILCCHLLNKFIYWNVVGTNVTFPFSSSLALAIVIYVYMLLYEFMSRVSRANEQRKKILAFFRVLRYIINTIYNHIRASANLITAICILWHWMNEWKNNALISNWNCFPNEKLHYELFIIIIIYGYDCV